MRSTGLRPREATRCRLRIVHSGWAASARARATLEWRGLVSRTALLDRCLNSTAQDARSLLDEIAAGRWDVMLAVQFASSVMNLLEVRLAAEVLRLGPHTIERAELLVRVPHDSQFP